MTIADAGWSTTSAAVASWKPRLLAARRSSKATADGWQDCPPDRRVATNAATQGNAAIDQLVASRYLDAAVASRGKELINFLFKANTVDAAIAPDNGGLTFYWAALDMSITIDVYPSIGYWWSARNVGGHSFSGEGVELPLIELKHQLNQFSKEVERQNPNWRSIVR